jgi:hypothetical protein
MAPKDRIIGKDLIGKTVISNFDTKCHKGPRTWTDIIRMIKSRRMRWKGNLARMWEKRNVYRILVRKPEGKRPIGRPSRRWGNNIKMDLRER